MNKRKIRAKKGIREYTYLGCPLTQSNSAWCYRMCVPDKNGKGYCGRIAPHSVKSRIQIGIENYKQMQLSGKKKKG